MKPFDPLMVFIELMQRADASPRVDWRDEVRKVQRQPEPARARPRRAPTRGRWVPVSTEDANRLVAAGLDGGVYRALLECDELVFEVTEPGPLVQVWGLFQARSLHVGGLRIIRYDRFEASRR